MLTGSKSYLKVSLGLFLACVLVGCGETKPPEGTVEGKVLIGGEPPKQPIRVQFINSRLGRGASGVTEPDGTYRLSRPLRVDDEKFEYSVFFEPVGEDPDPQAPAASQTILAIPRKYRNDTSTPLKFQVEPGKNVINLDVPTS